ncbi:MAG: radical SAM protein [Deltaproteobacteria bacterium]|nr:radical SAM protein [Deltaproteobacteria bacterium]
MATVGFPEKISPFLRSKLAALESSEGNSSPSYLGLARQYVYDPREDQDSKEQNAKHYEAAVQGPDHAHDLPGLERLYRRTLVIEPTLVCLAHCRYCLRSNYQKHTLTEKELIDVARYCGNAANRDTLNEVLITGGDPLIIPNRIEVLLNALIDHAPNIQIIRLATRLTTQDPTRIDESVLGLFLNKPSLRFELATQINHPVEFFQESIEAFAKVTDLGVRIYSQNVLLKGVNDDLDSLIELYDAMRRNRIEAHYLFHSVPIRGTHHLRTSVARGIDLARSLTSSGRISGRAKPMFAAMTDIGKITFYEGTIVDRRDGKLLLRSQYRLADRRAWNPTWQPPETAVVDQDGYLSVWYVDGEG